MKNLLITGILFVLIFYSGQVRSQKILIRTADTVKINTALRTIQQYEPEIYSKIIKQSIIQFGIIPEKPTLNFAISDDTDGQMRHWIMLNPALMVGLSNDIIATVIVHEAMHLGYNMNLYKGLDTDRIELRDKHEHTVIYNYELKFLKKIGASDTDIESRKQIMRQHSIPII